MVTTLIFRLDVEKSPENTLFALTIRNSSLANGKYRDSKKRYRKQCSLAAGTTTFRRQTIILLSALPMLLIAIGAKLTSAGPILFRQRRYGLNGEVIEVLKFRTPRVMM